MPKKYANIRSTSSARSGVKKGSCKTKLGRTASGRARPSGPNIFADSLSSIRLHSVPGAKAVSGCIETGGFESLLKAIRKCVRKLYPNQTIKAPSGISDFSELNWWIKQLRKSLPSKADFRILQEDNKVCIDVYQEGIWPDWNIYFLFCDDILAHLKATDPGGYKLFILFLNQFIYVIKCDSWETGVFGEAIDWLEELLKNDDLDYVVLEGDVDEIKKEIEYFTTGEVKQLASQIYLRKHCGIRFLQDKSAKVKDPFIRELIRLGCEVMLPGYSMTDFVDIHAIMHDDYRELGMRFDSQAILMVSVDGCPNISTEYDQRVEIYASEGGFMSPVNQLRIKPEGTSPVDLLEFKKRGHWIWELNKFFDSWTSVAILYNERPRY